MKVFITTSGIGSRLGKLTEYTNKSMVKIGKKPVLSYIIEQYPEDYEFVITLGYFGDHVKQFLDMAYPDRKFTYVWVDNYAGEGSSQVYSQLQAKEYLQEPFIYNDCDTIIDDLQEIIPRDFDYNFLVGYETNSELYDSFDYDKTSKQSDGSYKITNIYKKPDVEDAMLSYIGIAGIYDYKKFWETFEYACEHDDWRILNDTYVYYKYRMFDDLRALITHKWIDTGSISGVMKFRKECTDKLNILDKNDQAIFIIGDKVIKFFAKDGWVDKLMAHNEIIKNFTPEIIDKSPNFFSYKFINGYTAIDNMDPVIFENLLKKYEAEGLWQDREEEDKSNFFKKCQYKFYIQRTIDRVKRFRDVYKIKEDEDIIINNVLIPAEFTVERMLLDLQKLPEYKQSHFTGWHGDFTLENIIFDNEKNDYVLIDHRQGFEDELYYGDKIYDFAKMNMNLIFNFNSVYNDWYKVKEKDNKIHVSILSNNMVMDCREVLKNFVEKQNISYDYINILTGVVFLDLCPLFNDPLTKFLYYIGKYFMYTNLIKYNKVNNEK